MRIFVYPQHKENQILNPYVNNQEWALGKQFEIVHPEYRLRLPQPLRLLLGSFKADIYVLNWIETAGEGDGPSFLRGIIALIALHILSFRKAKIVWVFHNIHPHSGETMWSRRISRLLFKRATLIVSHSQEAADYANIYARCPVYFRNHPIPIKEYGAWDKPLPECDFFIWGNVTPYKGVLELLSNPLCKESGLKFLVVGMCSDPKLATAIEKQCDENIVYENRRAGFDEISAQCRKAKYVLIPYVGESVSSSGVLMDTLQMGGTPVGPNRGAFADLAKENCCLVYNDINEIFQLPFGEHYKRVSSDTVVKFFGDNTWEAFGLWVKKIIENESID